MQTFILSDCDSPVNMIYYTYFREWPYLSCTELVAKPFYLLLCSIIIFVCIILLVKEMVIQYV